MAGAGVLQANACSRAVARLAVKHASQLGQVPASATGWWVLTIISLPVC